MANIIKGGVKIEASQGKFAKIRFDKNKRFKCKNRSQAYFVKRFKRRKKKRSK